MQESIEGVSSNVFFTKLGAHKTLDLFLVAQSDIENSNFGPAGNSK